MTLDIYNSENHFKGKKRVRGKLLLKDLIYIIEHYFGYEVSKPLIEKNRERFNEEIDIITMVGITDLQSFTTRNWSEQDFFKVQAMLKDFRQWMKFNKGLLREGIWKSTKKQPEERDE